MSKTRKYVIYLTKKQLSGATDMLRYDSAYKVEIKGDEVVIYAAQYTPARWLSFDIRPTNVIELDSTVSERTENYIRSSGFMEGLRFAQQWEKATGSGHSTYYVQD